MTPGSCQNSKSRIFRPVLIQMLSPSKLGPCRTYVTGDLDRKPGPASRFAITPRSVSETLT
jgi:hypothetical protein